MIAPEQTEPPIRLIPEELAPRWHVTPRTAGELLRRMKVAGVVRKIGKFLFGSLSACDAWIATGEAPKRGRR